MVQYVLLVINIHVIGNRSMCVIHMLSHMAAILLVHVQNTSVQSRYQSLPYDFTIALLMLDQRGTLADGSGMVGSDCAEEDDVLPSFRHGSPHQTPVSRISHTKI